MSSNIRLQRTNNEIFKTITAAIMSMDSEILADIDIVSVDTSADLSSCKVFVDVKGSEEARKMAIAELERVSSHLRSEVSKQVSLRQTPNLRFFLDKGRDNAERVEQLLAKINSSKK